MGSHVQAAQADKSAPIQILNDFRIRCTADQWLEYYEWLLSEYSFKTVEITTPFRVQVYGSGNIKQPDGTTEKQYYLSLEKVCPAWEEWDYYGVNLLVDRSDLHLVAIDRILKNRWPNLQFVLPTPAGDWA